MKKLKTCLSLFLTMFKIGLFTFGGGYAMIAVIQRELVEKKKWIQQEEYLDVVAIAESTPGPLAINSATFIGYKVCGVLGSIFATLGVVLPSFIIIFIISLFFDKFLELKFVGYAFRGIQACVGFLILSAGLKMFKGLKKSVFNLTLFIITIIALTLLDLFALNFSTVFFVLIGGAVGIVVYLISLIKNKEKGEK
ncbi:MAG: chromate transporter [Clostridia bacterium]|nr:chromate transporter [Clostridia bacterium]